MSNPLEAIWNLFFSPEAAAEYQENPQEYLAETGLDQCDPAEINELVALAYEKGPVNQGATVNVGGNQGVGGSSQSSGWGGNGGGGGRWRSSARRRPRCCRAARPASGQHRRR